LDSKLLSGYIHDAMNALGIAKGMIEAVQKSNTGQTELTLEQKNNKLDKAISALDRLHNELKNIRLLYKE